jgi:prepilin-type N-terminal cleavage/methylation domain-containing protein
MKGFTLIELLVVVTVLSVLAIIVLISVNPLEQIRRAQDARVRSDLRQLTKAIDNYYVSKGAETGKSFYPTSLSELVPEYIKQIPKPPYPIGGHTTNDYYYVRLPGLCDNSTSYCINYSIIGHLFSKLERNKHGCSPVSTRSHWVYNTWGAEAGTYASCD